MDQKDGEFLIRFARETIELWVKDRKVMKKPRNLSDEFYEERGVFVTLHTYPGKELRGCIGIPQPVKPLIEAVIESAMSVTQDPRFPDLTMGELDRVIVEVSILTKPERIRVKKPEEYPERVEIGKDGLIIKNGMQSGLLLPQVPKEYGWDAKAYLEHLCMKASLPPDAWTFEGTEILRFRSEIFSEETPGGRVEKA
ncbi:MAG: TIGR00296 family protein [Candidatus Aenigmarchaeota archaeon]|nr:TIGR00296 family protein [Candidatus Aenigmarchaeota archaeon]NIP40394.1 TIGR00296 family protein [Candidatus Aenigmarchaeota archaeon]NIQ18320.1 TIGR00296 family protein [Candidatus Aenigmarchaeota archaeon]NIS73272.1 TIGR00296 family protein [Candidatus Aenigmarchaeota archaeon]